MTQARADATKERSGSRSATGPHVSSDRSPAALTRWLCLAAAAGLIGTGISMLGGCPPNCGRTTHGFEGRVLDARGTQVPIDAVSAVQDGRPLECQLGAFANYVGAPAGNGPDHVFYTFACRLQQGSGFVDVTLQAQGQTLRKSVFAKQLGDAESECGTDFEVDNVVFTLEGPGCTDDEQVAVLARVVGTDAQAKLTLRAVEVYAWLDCKMSGDVFECPTSLPYASSYTLEVETEFSILERQIAVDAEACVVTPAEVTIDLSGAECATQERTWTSHVRTPCGDKLPAPKVRSRLGDGELHDCAVQPPTPATPGKCDYGYVCATETPTGGGLYSVEATAPSGQRHLIRMQVHDDGCSPLLSEATPVLGRIALSIE